MASLFLRFLSHYAYLDIKELEESTDSHCRGTHGILLKLLEGGKACDMHDGELCICVLFLLGGEHLEREDTFACVHECS